MHKKCLERLQEFLSLLKHNPQPDGRGHGATVQSKAAKASEREGDFEMSKFEFSFHRKLRG